MRIRNPELHSLYKEIDRLTDEDQQALVVLLDSLVKRSADAQGDGGVTWRLMTNVPPRFGRVIPVLRGSHDEELLGNISLLIYVER